MKRLLFPVLISLLFTNAFSISYVPLDSTTTVRRKQISKDFEEFQKKVSKELPSDLNWGQRSEVNRKFKLISKTIDAGIQEDRFIYDTRFTNYVDSLFALLRKNNPDIPSDIKFFITKDIPINAYYYGNKVIEINLGSFYFLQNDDQIAAIIAHEIAHYVSKHSVKDILYYYNLNKSSELKDEVYNLQSNRENKSELAYTKLKAILYSNGRRNKKKEMEADSLGYEIFRRSNFNKYEFVNNLQLFDLYNKIKPIGLQTETYKSLFNLPTQSFKAAWLNQEDFSTYDYSKFSDRYNEDSLSTHPVIEARIARLKSIFSELNELKPTLQTSPRLDSLSHIAHYEQLPSLMYNEQYGIGVYVCMLNLQMKTDDQFYCQWLGKFFEKIYQARKNYTLNRYLERIDPRNQSPSYMQFISFMWNLKLNEIKQLSDYYNKNKESKI